VRDRKKLLRAALDRNRVELRIPGGVDVARGGEEDGPAVGSEPLGDVGAGVPRQPLRNAAVRADDVDVDVALVLGREGDPLPVG
jgi:hypothetical protein